MNEFNNQKSTNRYLIKSKLLAKNLPQKMSKIHQALYLFDYGLTNENCNFIKLSASDAYNQMREFREKYPYIYRECERINYASFKRQSRLAKRISDMLASGECIFGTFTFTDETLLTTNEKTRRVIVRRFLKSQSNDFVANVDYGKKNSREHYHFVIKSEHLDLSEYRKYGNINVKRIKTKNINKSKDNVKLAKYVAKLTNHAIKETTKQNRIIYSKK